MSKHDLDINRQVRSVFVRHWIDLGRISIRTSGGRTYIRGSLERIKGFEDELTNPIVDGLFMEIKRIRDVKSTTVQLENWTNATGCWMPTEKEDKKLDRAKRHVKPDEKIYDVDKGLKQDQF